MDIDRSISKKEPGGRSIQETGQVPVAKPQSGRQVEGIVQRELPARLFEVALEGKQIVKATVTDRATKDFLRLLPGDRVILTLSPQDATRGRIVERKTL